MIYLKQLIALVACFGLLGLSGCLNGGNSDLGTVTGVVTVDGEPINYATVTFMPTQGRASVGLTDADGAYKLVYVCLLYTSPSPRDRQKSRMPSSA